MRQTLDLRDQSAKRPANLASQENAQDHGRRSDQRNEQSDPDKGVEDSIARCSPGCLFPLRQISHQGTHLSIASGLGPIHRFAVGNVLSGEGIEFLVRLEGGQRQGLERRILQSLGIHFGILDPLLDIGQQLVFCLWMKGRGVEQLFNVVVRAGVDVGSENDLLLHRGDRCGRFRINELGDHALDVIVGLRPGDTGQFKQLTLDLNIPCLLGDHLLNVSVDAIQTIRFLARQNGLHSLQFRLQTRFELL